jgi:glycyl-tRNA synthetase beta subunit
LCLPKVNSWFSQQEKLGTMLDKTMRIEKIVPGLATALQIEQDKMLILEKSASYVFSDLSSEVVTEFTSLAGIMARHYALRDGLTPEVHCCLYFIIIVHTSDVFCGFFSAIWIFNCVKRKPG